MTNYRHQLEGIDRGGEGEAAMGIREHLKCDNKKEEIANPSLRKTNRHSGRVVVAECDNNSCRWEIQTEQTKIDESKVIEEETLLMVAPPSDRLTRRNWDKWCLMIMKIRVNRVGGLHGGR